MDLVILSAGTPYPGADRFGSAYLLDLGQEKLLFDCGPAATYKLAKSGISPTSINGLFFTHHHFDHNADYGCFALSRWDQGAGLIPDLQVWGPWPTREISEGLFGERGVFHFDVQARCENIYSQIAHQLRGGKLPRQGLKLVVEELQHGARVAGEGWQVEAATVPHIQPVMESLAYRLECAAGSIVFAGDCSPCDSLLQLAHGADTLVMMCWDEQKTMDTVGYGLGMTGTTGAGQVAADAQVRRLILVHMVRAISSGPGRQRAMEQVAERFSGEIIVADELARLKLA